MAANPQKAASKQILKVNEEKWTPALMAAGWTAFPNVILENLEALQLDAVDIAILLYLSTHWWTAPNVPRPAKATIAKAIGVNPRTIQRHITQMEKRGLIEREERRIAGEGSDTNLYHFAGLIKKAKPFADAKVAEIAEKVAKKKLKTKGNLTLVKSDS